MIWPRVLLRVTNPVPTRFGRVLTDDPTGYKPGAAKSLDEYAKLDAEDDSLARWKASLGVVPGASGPASGPKVSQICKPDSKGNLLATVFR
jgi:hypothetical protein